MRKAWLFFRRFKVWKLDILSFKNNFWWKMVGVRGFEPPTPSSRTRCATSLRYTPTNWCWRAYTVMTDFSQVFFKKTRSTIIHFVSVSPSSLARNHLFLICFSPLPVSSPRVTAFLLCWFEKFFAEARDFAGGVAIFAVLKSCLPTSRTSCRKFDRFFVSERFFPSPPFCEHFGAFPVHLIGQRSRRRAPLKAG